MVRQDDAESLPYAARTMAVLTVVAALGAALYIVPHTLDSLIIMGSAGLVLGSLLVILRYVRGTLLPPPSGSSGP